jgi:hypothetical protein
MSEHPTQRTRGSAQVIFGIDISAVTCNFPLHRKSNVADRNATAPVSDANMAALVRACIVAFNNSPRVRTNMCSCVLAVGLIAATIMGSSPLAAAGDPINGSLQPNLPCLPWQTPRGERASTGAARESPAAQHEGRYAINMNCLPWRSPIGHRQPRAADLGALTGLPEEQPVDRLPAR